MTSTYHLGHNLHHEAHALSLDTALSIVFVPHMRVLAGYA